MLTFHVSELSDLKVLIEFDIHFPEDQVDDPFRVLIIS